MLERRGELYKEETDLIWEYRVMYEEDRSWGCERQSQKKKEMRKNNKEEEMNSEKKKSRDRKRKDPDKVNGFVLVVVQVSIFVMKVCEVILDLEMKELGVIVMSECFPVRVFDLTASPDSECDFPATLSSDS